MVDRWSSISFSRSPYLVYRDGRIGDQQNGELIGRTLRDVIIDLDLTAQEEAMSALLWAGTIVGAACGLGHGVYVYGRVSRETPLATPGGPNRPRAISYALWTLALWSLFGVYVTVLWIVACCFYIPSPLFGPTIHSSPNPR